MEWRFTVNLIINIIFALIIVALITTFLIFIKRDDGKSKKILKKKELSESERKIQQRVVKEIQNFLNYNGEEQDDIL